MRSIVFNTLGVLAIIAAVICGLYAGVWWAFIGGIVQAIEAAKATPIDSMHLAIGIAKVMFSAIIGWLTFIIGAAVSGFFFALGKIRS